MTNWTLLISGQNERVLADEVVVAERGVDRDARVSAQRRNS
jgi:hypothetical protein